MGIQHELDHDESADYEFVRTRPCFVLWRQCPATETANYKLEIVRIYGDRDDADAGGRGIVDSFITREDFVAPEDHL